MDPKQTELLIDALSTWARRVAIRQGALESLLKHHCGITDSDLKKAEVEAKSRLQTAGLPSKRIADLARMLKSF